MERLEDVPKWVVEAGVDYANDEFEEHDQIRDIEDEDGEITIEFFELDGKLDNTIEDNSGIKESSNLTINYQTAKETPEKFKKQLERRND